MTQTFRRGLVEGIPIVLSYVTFGSAFGVLAVKAGLPVWAAVAMSLLGYAGSAQFVVLSLLETGSPLSVMIGSTFLLNLRHLLLSSSLTTKLPRLQKRQISYLAHTITDESYGVNMMRARRHGSLDYPAVMGTNTISHCAWVLATWMGATFGHLVPADLSILNGAIPIMFASLLAFQLLSHQDWFWMLASGGVMVIALQILGGNWAFLATVVIIPTLAMMVDRKKGKTE